MPPPDDATLASDAHRGFPAAQPPLTPGQADTLAAMAVYQVVNDLDSEARLAPPGLRRRATPSRSSRSARAPS